MFTLKFEKPGYKFTCSAHSYSVSRFSGGSASGSSLKSHIVTAYSSQDDNVGVYFHISCDGMYDKNQQFEKVYIENQSGKTIDCFKFESHSE